MVSLAGVLRTAKKAISPLTQCPHDSMIQSTGLNFLTLPRIGPMMYGQLNPPPDAPSAISPRPSKPQAVAAA
jgi:hypothetical protein